MQIVDYYKEMFQENLRLVASFINSTENKKVYAAKKRYEKKRKSPKIS